MTDSHPSKSHFTSIRIFLLLTFFTCLFLMGCNEVPNKAPGSYSTGGLFIPDDFEAVVVVDSLEGKAREITVNDNGDIYVKLRYSFKDGGIAALRDTDGDGRADIIKRFGDYEHKGNWGFQTAVEIYNDYLYFSTELAVYRYRLNPEKLVPDSELELIVLDDHEHGDHEHNGKPIAFDKEGNLYVPFGAPSNACQQPKRTPGQPGLDPCPQLEHHAGVWRFDANKIGQTQKDGVHFASGIRSMICMDWNDEDDNLYLVMHGRDDLLRLFPDQYTPWESAMLPSEEFLKVTEGSDFGWPYCYYDQLQEKKVLAPEYGGDGGDSIGRCSDYDLPIMGFPGHWAPNGILFYTGDQFPARYKNGAFVAFHGSTIRAPYPQSGYFVAFIPFKNGAPTGEWEVFADGFAQIDTIVNVSDAVYRPMGLAMGPDGSLYLSETEKGKVWKVTFKGDKNDFGETQLAAMEKRKERPNIKTPHEKEDNLMNILADSGEGLYFQYCGICHQRNGRGASGRYPPLRGTDWVTGDKERLIKVVLNGMEGGVEVNGKLYNSVMPQHSFLPDEEIASILTFIRQNFGNDASAVSEEEVNQVRASTTEP